ncbi:hypothetical protein [Sphingomonas sp. ACRSK]|uniref:hypothetical protein n=1 Tax=Sphingomonas sp. ACRSK TaxID=2918213 RepID=UPI001EF5CD3E|nr:hypothetical protein [Sphingomonas sp. ACRSK]MCG7348832.1 hypothetical protein [Sphingomonas sp. ACRSK]
MTILSMVVPFTIEHRCSVIQVWSACSVDAGGLLLLMMGSSKAHTFSLTTRGFSHAAEPRLVVEQHAPPTVWLAPNGPILFHGHAASTSA